MRCKCSWIPWPHQPFLCGPHPGPLPSCATPSPAQCTPQHSASRRFCQRVVDSRPLIPYHRCPPPCRHRPRLRPDRYLSRRDFRSQPSRGWRHGTPLRPCRYRHYSPRRSLALGRNATLPSYPSLPAYAFFRSSHDYICLLFPAPQTECPDDGHPSPEPGPALGSVFSPTQTCLRHVPTLFSFWPTVLLWVLSGLRLRWCGC